MSTAAAARTRATGARRRKDRLVGFTYHGAGGSLAEKISRRVSAPNFPNSRRAIRPVKNPAAGTPKRAWMRWRSTGVSAEVLYADLWLRLFALEDAELQEACFQIANDWMMEYCKAAPGRLVGIPDDLDVQYPQRDQRARALQEKRHDRLHDLAGPAGAICRSPAITTILSGKRRPRLDMPVNVHILTGFNYSRFDRKGLDTYRMTVNQKLTDAANTLFDLRLRRPLGEISQAQIGLRRKRSGLDSLLTSTSGTNILSATARRRRCRT